MRLQLLSDLHLESNPGFVAEHAPGADVLVLAGDVGSYQKGSQLLYEVDFGLGRFSPQRPGSPWQTVIYVPGNHEYDDLPHAATRARLRRLCEGLGIVWLDRESVVVDGVRFLGCTLWSDFDALASPEALALKASGQGGGSLTGTPSRKHVRKAAQLTRGLLQESQDSLLTRQLQARDKAFKSANFYLRSHTTTQADGTTPMLAEDLRELGLRDQAWLREALVQPHDGWTVVVTHFAPSLRSADPRYGLVPGTAGFCNALDALLPLADVWMHGHLHCAVDYTAEGLRPDGRPGRCRVVANPLGYASKREQQGYQPRWALDLPPRAAPAAQADGRT